jgi:hypothetical protein
MILYHFTALEHRDAIMTEGLRFGNINLAQRDVRNGVWFTTETEPSGHGQEKQNHFARFGQKFPGSDTHWPTKGQLRIKVVIPSTDRQLVKWTTWGRKRCDAQLYEFLKGDVTGGQAYKTWFIYLGTVAPDRFKEVQERSAQMDQTKISNPML